MKIAIEIDINASPEEVFYWLGDPTRAMRWMTSVTRTEYIHEAPDMVGTTFREYVEEDGQGTELQGVVKEFVPNERMGFQLEGEHNKVETVFTLTETKEGTHLRQDINLHFKGITRLMSILFGAAFKKKIIGQSRREFATLKQLCEGGVSQ
ncbi:MAG: hypothetical protein DWQ07_06730 [Chloroflexi bacterium]|nr:MAG: hypothetical protein DWQ07_06730 [Chloroflexota bacterium]MBL1195605.1 hypothetical protein [Chloroflexota bacterium]NOH12892.1 hypothetical protein [Chloroflexota bacterium]